MSIEFEGDIISDMVGKLPAMQVEMPDSYARGTVLRMQVEVRVKSVRHEENRKGDLERHHIFALESINLVSSFQPSEDRTVVTGSASATPAQTPEDAEELGGLEIGRTADKWGGSAPLEVREDGVFDKRTGELLSEREPALVPEF